MTLPNVVIVGRPNVGKSTLFNRILGRREAIVEERPGVTRDRKDMVAEWQGVEFNLVDTGGWMASGSELEGKVSAKAHGALKGAAAVLFVVDSTVSVTNEDSAVAEFVRKLGVPVFVVANKVDSEAARPQVFDFFSLGLGEPFAASSLHGLGVADLLDEIVAVLPPPEESSQPEGEAEEKILSVVIVGRPNVGKSTLFNRLIGEERSIVHDMPGTTRDTIDTVVETQLGSIRFLDTAGIRRKSRIDEDTEFYSVMRALKSVDKADVALFVLDGTQGVTQQDQRLCERVDAAGCPIVLVLNKMDLMSTEAKLDLTDQIERRLSFLPTANPERISALTGKGVERLMPSLAGVVGEFQKRIPTKDVNKVVRLAQQAQPAPAGARVLYATQGATDPPTFTLFSNKEIGDSYLRYIERELRAKFEMGSTPIKIRVRLRNE